MAIGVAQHLEVLKNTLPEDQYRAEIIRLATNAIRTGKTHEEYWHGLVGDFDWLDWEDLVVKAKAEPESVSSGAAQPSPDMQQQMLDSMRQQIPEMKTQAQLNAFMGAFEALQGTLRAIFSGAGEEQIGVGRQALEMALQVAETATTIREQLEEAPELDVGHEFTAPPEDVMEYDVQRQLLVELSPISTLDELSAWYEATSDRRDQVMSTGLRNNLLDSIRKKKVELS